MMKGVLEDESMSNLTSSSNQAPPSKKKRNLPGNPDPEAEVVALSPRTLMATNRFVCEVCNKGFQRDQNLQLHRRGHNLPWKLKQRTNKEVIRKKVYVCPEPSCVHHDPGRALGDLTGIKKHYCRKHGEKKWKCEKCSKRYAVQSDWKAHSKICGTREYRCDCGTLFSRRDSFITHRAFCDALAEENARPICENPILPSSQTGPSTNTHYPNLQTELHTPVLQPLKREQDLHQSFNPRHEIPPWLDGGPSGPPPNGHLSSQLFTSRLNHHPIINQENNPNPNNNPNHNHNHINHDHNLSSFQPTSSFHSPHISATALLQKAAQMGVTLSKPCQAETVLGPHQAHMSPIGFNPTSLATTTAGSDLGLSAHDETGTASVRGLSSFGNEAVFSVESGDRGRFQESGFEEECFNRIMNSKNNSCFEPAQAESAGSHLSRGGGSGGGGGNSGGGGGGRDGLTRDFLGLRAFPNRDFFDMAGLDRMGSSSHDNKQNKNQQPWQS